MAPYGRVRGSTAGFTTGSDILSRRGARLRRCFCDTRDMPIDPVLLEILVCPLSKAPLREVDGALVSTDPETRMRYRIDGTVPVMMVEEAEQLTEEEWKAVMGRG